MNFKNLNSTWIWRDGSVEPNQYVSFCQKFELSDTDAKLYISCDTTYVAYLNNRLIGFGQYLSVPENKFYDILKLNNASVVGENVLTIDVYYQGISSSCYATGKPGLIYTIEENGKYIPNSNVVCRKTPGFKEGNIFPITRQLGPSFEYTAAEEGEIWKDALILDFDNLLPFSLRKRPVKKLISDTYTEFCPAGTGKFLINTESDNPADRIYTALCAPQFCSAKSPDTEGISITEDNTYVLLDLGGETTGYFTLELEAEEDVRIDVGFGEHIIDGRVRTKIGERSFAFTYYTKNGENLFTNYFRRLGAKYLQLNFSNLKGTLKLKYAGLLKGEYPVKEADMPNITDSLDKEIYRAGVKTLRCCMHEHYEDSPWREQSLYSLDARNQALYGYSAFADNYSFVKASIELMASSVRSDGFFKMTAPTSSLKTIPSFTLIWLVWIAEYVDYSKDKSFLLQNESKIFRIISMLEKQLKDDLLPLPRGEEIWNFYDWTPGLNDVQNKETDAIYNLYFCLALNKLMLIEKNIRRKDLIIKIRTIYKTVKKAINKTFYNKDEKIYYTFSDDCTHKCKLAQALALCSGVAKSKKSLRKKLIARDDMVSLTLSTKQFEYEALMPQIKIYGDYILENIRQIWGKMILEGCDTFYETEKGAADFDNAGSLCHGWSAAPVYWYRLLFGKNYIKTK